MSPQRELHHVEPEGGSVLTRWHDRSTIETVYRGYVTPALMRRAELDVYALLDEHPALYRLVDTLGITGYAPVIKGNVEELWHRFKARGGREILFISTAPLIKMQGSVVAMNEAVRIRFFQTRAEALEHLATLKS